MKLLLIPLSKILEEKNLPLAKFKEKWSRLESCVAAFLGHRSLWEKCAEGKDSYLILEHDAVFDSSINAHLLYTQDHDIDTSTKDFKVIKASSDDVILHESYFK